MIVKAMPWSSGLSYMSNMNCFISCLRCLASTLKITTKILYLKSKQVRSCAQRPAFEPILANSVSKPTDWRLRLGRPLSKSIFPLLRRGAVKDTMELGMHPCTTWVLKSWSYLKELIRAYAFKLRLWFPLFDADEHLLQVVSKCQVTGWQPLR